MDFGRGHLTLFSKATVLLVFASTFALMTTGCTHPVNVTYSLAPSVSYSTKNGLTTGVIGTIKVTPQSQVVGLTPGDLLAATPADGSVVAFYPTGFSYSSSDPATATFTATTDTGYSSTTVVELQQCNCYVGAVPTGYSAYAFQIASSNVSAWEAWMAQVAANTDASANISVSSTIAASEVNPPAGTYNATSGAVDQSGETIATATAPITVAPPPTVGCGAGNNHVICTKP